VVDDIATNLKVVAGLLAPYLAVVDTCLNGLQAIELVKQHEYDVVFMDHMMPDMDGIETTAVIRLWEKEQQKKSGIRSEEAPTKLALGITKRQIPIIALTANAVVGMREMFIENGFNDFLSKPIDVSKLDEMLDRWIPKEKREQGTGNREQGTINNEGQNTHSSLAQSPVPKAALPPPQSLVPIPGIDTAKGISMTGGTLNAYTQVLKLFCIDARDRLPLLQKAPEITALNAFITQVHALKSALASIGAAEISTIAAGLEAAGKAADMPFIQEHLPAFAQQLAALVKNIQSALEQGKPENHDVPSSLFPVPSSPFPVPPSLLFTELSDALRSQKIPEIKRILNELDQQTQDPKLREILARISDQVLMTEFDSALRIIDEVRRS